MKIACIVVTYNRLEMLKKCIESLEKQSNNNFDIIVVNNGSTDNTKLWLSKKKNIKTLNQGNLGGAGGFYSGIEHAYKDGYDWFWLMDDDGVTDNGQLKALIDKSIGNNLMFTNALVCNIDNPTELSFGLQYKNESITKRDVAFKYDLMPLSINPFNGTFINRTVIKKIGNVKKEMFIWGDEKEFSLRAIKNGFTPTTITSAIHLHPKINTKLVNIVPFLTKYKLFIRPIDKMKYFIRNMGFINKNYYGQAATIKFALKYIIHYALIFNFRQLYLFLKYYLEGIKNRYD
jgi:rhamnopyranosyl-N-acetylglucosaminyl-diphospho-decaprenol beta-1,3/1,4-galactofuranosyltransferase